MNALNTVSKTIAPAVLALGLSFGAMAADPKLSEADKIDNAQETAECIIPVVDKEIGKAVQGNQLPNTAAIQQLLIENTVKCISEVTGVAVEDMPAFPDATKITTMEEQQKFFEELAAFDTFVAQYVDLETVDAIMTAHMRKVMVELMEKMQKERAPAASERRL